MRTALLLVAAILASVLAPTAAAQKYPTKPIRLIVPFSPGGGTDIMSRLLSIPVGESIGETVVVDNRPGAGGSLGAELAALAPPDGYTIIMVSSSYTASGAYRKLPYDPVDGITPIVLIGTTGLIMSINPSIPAKSVSEFIAYAKARPGKLNYASAGTGAVNNLGTEYFNLLTGTNLVHVPFRGGGPALRGVIGGEVHMSFTSLVPTLPHVKSGRLRALAITTPKRSPLLPDVPSVSETVPAFEVTHWYGMWGPKGMPKSVVALWNKEIGSLVQTPKMKRRLRNEGLEPAGGPPSQMYGFVKRDVNKWRGVMKRANIQQAR
ncbi:MAG: tripartite tricarboxylate transporter substrate binding protein [Betaproteobacteria bacterium]|nr:tripartite tricarboxylate transporter substrate binding protein [Betaproteobacteria bacterium]MDH3437074.1 tripartite tricarboxylate transporter substrate binding protein [Betaproteobacteria bacterium]